MQNVQEGGLTLATELCNTGNALRSYEHVDLFAADVKVSFICRCVGRDRTGKIRVRATRRARVRSGAIRNGICMIAAWYKAVDEIAQSRGNEHCVLQGEMAQKGEVQAGGMR